MQKTFIILTIISIIILTGLLVHFKLNKDFLLLWNSNNVTVSSEGPLITDKVKIEFGVSVNTISRANDLDLFKNRDKYTVIYDGELKDIISNEYGENDYLITYDGQYYISFRHFKFNRRHQHNYHFHFYKKDKNIYIEVQIDGQDEMKFERVMLEIEKASGFVCGNPVDSAGVIHNMD